MKTSIFRSFFWALLWSNKNFLRLHFTLLSFSLFNFPLKPDKKFSFPKKNFCVLNPNVSSTPINLFQFFRGFLFLHIHSFRRKKWNLHEITIIKAKAAFKYFLLSLYVSFFLFYSRFIFGWCFTRNFIVVVVVFRMWAADN